MGVYDAIVIGAGQAGPGLATGLAGLGRKVALIEGNLLGGSCVNYGCTPTKTLRKSARVAFMAREAQKFGVSVGDVTVDFGAVMARVHQVVENSRNGLEGWVHSYPQQLDVIHGWAQFAGKDGDNFLVAVNGETHSASQIYLNTGTRAFIPHIEGIEAVNYLDNISLLNLTELPQHLLILGGGYIGIEMGQIFRRLGSQVTIIEGGAHLAGREDADVCQIIENMLADEGVNVLTNHKSVRVAQDVTGIHLTLQSPNGETVVTGSHFLVAVGRLPNTDQLNLASIGVATDERGFIPVNGKLEANVPNVFAVGDINKRGAFTHTSYQDYEIVMANLHGQARSADGRVTTYAMFSDPPMGRVGMSENEARQSGKNILLAVHEMKNVSRAKEESETIGIIKLLVDADSEAFVGACVFGIGGDEIIQVISNYMATGASYRLLKDALPVHPTVTEFFPTILGKLAPLA
jgi:pyruvate/2-oxoglutarate dehydrogenase complex dihydrolipoamide dehydrogenase (E3) component